MYVEYRYGNLLSPAKALTVTHEMFPDHFILSTEACEGKYDFLILVCCSISHLKYLGLYKYLLITYFTSIGDKPWQENVVLGSWERLESYAHDIIMVQV